MFAFLGPNGAGKTTTTEILEGYRDRSAGEVTVLGADPASAGREWRERIGIVLQQCRMRPELTVRETLALYAGYYRDPLGIEETIGTSASAAKADDRARAALRRPAAPPRRRRRPDRRPGPALPRRADHRLRPVGPAPGLGRDRRPRQARQDRLPHHPLHGRGPAPRRPRGDHRRAGGSSPRGARTSSATASERPTTISFRLPNGTPPGELPVQARERRRGRRRAGDRDADAGRGRSTGSPAGRWSGRSTSTGFASTARASRTSTSS